VGHDRQLRPTDRRSGTRRRCKDLESATASRALRRTASPKLRASVSARPTNTSRTSARSSLRCTIARFEQIARLIESTFVQHSAASLDDLVRALVEAMVEAHGSDPQRHELLATEVPHEADGRLRKCVFAASGPRFPRDPTGSMRLVSSTRSCLWSPSWWRPSPTARRFADRRDYP
jgi:hypothetical protein